MALHPGTFYPLAAFAEFRIEDKLGLSEQEWLHLLCGFGRIWPGSGLLSQEDLENNIFYGVAPDSDIAEISSCELAQRFSTCPFRGVGAGCSWAFLLPTTEHRVCVCGETLEFVSIPGATQSVVCGSAAKSLLSQMPPDEQLGFLRKHLCVVDQGCHIHKDMSSHLLCESRKAACPVKEEYEHAGLFDIFIEGFARSLQGTMEVFRGCGLRRSNKALVSITGVVALIVPASRMQLTYSVGGESYELSQGAMTCNTKPHDESPFRFCSWLICCGFSESSYEISSCSLGLYQSFLSHSSGLPHRHFFGVSPSLDTAQTSDRPIAPDGWCCHETPSEETFAEWRGYRKVLGCAQFFASPPKRWSTQGLLALQVAEQSVHDYVSFNPSWEPAWEAAMVTAEKKPAVCSAGLQQAGLDFLVNVAKEGATIQCCSLRRGQIPADLTSLADADKQLDSLPVLRLHSFTAPYWCRGNHLSHVSRLTWQSILASWETDNQLQNVRSADHVAPPDVFQSVCLLQRAEVS
eukprot:s1702_g3.t1